jgi:hypothetical protein
VTLKAPPIAILFSIVSPEYLLTFVSLVDVHSQTIPDLSNKPNMFDFLFQLGDDQGRSPFHTTQN